MSQFLKENLFQRTPRTHLAKTLTENRVLMLTEKINGLRIGQRAEAERKLDTLDRQVSALEEELEQVVVGFSDKHCELKHIVSMPRSSSAKSARSWPSNSHRPTAPSGRRPSTASKWL
jgi:hypothetical protein